MEAGDDQQEEEPEPECDVDLVIDHVDGQHAQTVKPDHNSESQSHRASACSNSLLNGARHAEVLEGTFCDFGEYSHHRICSLLIIQSRELQH